MLINLLWACLTQSIWQLSKILYDTNLDGRNFGGFSESILFCQSILSQLLANHSECIYSMQHDTSIHQYIIHQIRLSSTIAKVLPCQNLYRTVLCCSVHAIVQIVKLYVHGNLFSCLMIFCRKLVTYIQMQLLII